MAILKIFVSGEEQVALLGLYNVIEQYDSFILADVPDTKTSELLNAYLAEDITPQYKIDIGLNNIDTSRPRLTAAGNIKSHPAYTTTEKDLSTGYHHYLVQFNGPIKQQWLKGVSKTGAELRAPYADFTYVVRANQKTMIAVAGLPYVRWTGHLPFEARIESKLQAKTKKASPNPRTQSLPRTRILEGLYTVEFFDGADIKKALPAIRKAGFRIVTQEPRAKLVIVESKESNTRQKAQIKELSMIHGVRKIRERAINRPSNDVAAGIMGTKLSLGTEGASGLGLSGQGEIIAVCDTGIDTGNPETINQDFAGRVVAIKSYPITAEFSDYITNAGGDDGGADLDSGHGTHVAGSVLGDGTNSAGIAETNGPIRGLAHKAGLVFQAVEQELKWKDPSYVSQYGRYLLAGIPVNLETLFNYAYQKGARIHSNSWGGGNAGEYDDQSRQLDLFVWNKKDFCVLVAAGNDGTDNDGDGVINLMSVTSPGTAKNCITVGACENQRPEFNNERYGNWWPGDYPAAPYNTDPMADQPSQVVAFSSRGPTRDNRIKPDVLAPGTFILSTRSAMIAINNTAWAPFPPSRQYFHMGGTSMATPLAAGAVGLIREYLRTRQKIANPTAALLKAALIAGASKLPGISAPSVAADFHQGFGAVNVDNIVAPSSPLSAIFIDSKRALTTGQSEAHTFEITASAAPLKLVLAYSDYPGSALVNDLNLVLTLPDGKKMTGNSGMENVKTFDSNNNVEVIMIETPEPGSYVAEVVAANVPQGPQDYALVYIGSMNGARKTSASKR
jgi:serine protease AprX